MKSLLWVAVNFIGLIILVFIYNTIDKPRTKGKTEAGSRKGYPGQKLYGYFIILIMLYLVFDTAMYVIEGMVFRGAVILNYAVTVFYYSFLPLPGFVYLLFCDYKVFDDAEGFKRRLRLYSIPAIINVILVLLSPFTHMIFYIEENNLYARGAFFWIAILVSFGYVFAYYTVLAVNAKRKRGFAPKEPDIYLYILPIPPVIFAVIQLLVYGPLLVGIGFVISAYFIFTYSVQSSADRRRLSVRFNNINITQFAIISFIMVAGMFWVLEDIIDDISRNYAEYKSAGTVQPLKVYLNKEIGVLEIVASSRAIIEWFLDEGNPDKKRAAFDELISASRILHDKNLFIVASESGHQYSIEGNVPFEDFYSHAVVSIADPFDKWVFDLMDSPQRYNIIVDVDKDLERKSVWLNLKVDENGKTVGIVCIEMEFSGLAAQLLAQYDLDKTRVFIMDEQGVIQMDSALLGEDDFLFFGITRTIGDIVHYPELIAAIQTHLDGIDGYFQGFSAEPVVVRLFAGRHRYATITPIGSTNWSVVTLFDPSELFSPIKLLLPFAIITILFIVFVFSTNRIAQQLILIPLKLLVDSLRRMREKSAQDIYGIERDDEIGLLSTTIQDLFIKGHYDGLTGIYNRRYLEMIILKIMANLSRTKTELSVMMIDIDFFKKFNDTYGHLEGDECLKAVAQALNRTIMRTGDFVARYGGEEFVVILPNADEQGARAIADKMLKTVMELKIPHEKHDAGIVTISVGITTGSPNNALGWNDFLNKADEALYISKNEGRNRYTFLALSEAQVGA